MEPRIEFLGTGASGGTPGSGRSRRKESSAVACDGDTAILIDVTGDFEEQRMHSTGGSTPSCSPHEELARIVAGLCARASPAHDGMAAPIPG